MPHKKSGSKPEKRVAPRADAHLSMRVEGRPENGELTLVETESQNISSSGVYCTSPHYLAPLSKVALTIVLPGRSAASNRSSLLKCNGVVVRCLPAGVPSRPSGYHLACSFIGLDQRHQAAIEEFVTWRNLQAIRGNSPARGARKASASSARKAGSRAGPTARGRAARAKSAATRARRVRGR